VHLLRQAISQKKPPKASKEIAASKGGGSRLRTQILLAMTGLKSPKVLKEIAAIDAYSIRGISSDNGVFPPYLIYH
jgi:hypothetical protein